MTIRYDHIDISADVMRVPFEKLANLDGAIRQIHDCRPAAGFERIYAPGELEFLRQEEYRVQGIPLNQVTLADLSTAAERMEIGVGGYTWLTE